MERYTEQTQKEDGWNSLVFFCSAVVAVLSVLDSPLARTTLAPATVLPLGSVMVPRSDVAACPEARPHMHHVKHVNTTAAKTGCERTGRLLPRPPAADNILCLPIMGSPSWYGVGSQKHY